jgi:hypothetical protein
MLIFFCFENSSLIQWWIKITKSYITFLCTAAKAEGENPGSYTKVLITRYRNSAIMTSSRTLQHIQPNGASTHWLFPPSHLHFPPLLPAFTSHLHLTRSLHTFASHLVYHFTSHVHLVPSLPSFYPPSLPTFTSRHQEVFVLRLTMYNAFKRVITINKNPIEHILYTESF